MIVVKPERIKEIRQEVHDIGLLVEEEHIPTDSNRREFLFSELDTLISILNLLEERHYKESLIILRSSFEKFLFYWLMFEGKIYRFSKIIRIIPKTSKTSIEARDNTLSFYKKEKKNGNLSFKDVIDMRSIEQDKITLTYQWEGLYERNDKDRKGRIIPFYNYILEKYEPEMAHLSNIDTIEEGVISKSVIDSQKALHKLYYHRYFYIDNIYNNLIINNLIDKETKDKIKVHYNFLSGYIHPTKYNIKIWKDINYHWGYNNEDQPYEDLILLYVAKLMYLYIKIYVKNYKDSKDIKRFNKYEHIINELNEFSKDL